MVRLVGLPWKIFAIDVLSKEIVASCGVVPVADGSANDFRTVSVAAGPNVNGAFRLPETVNGFVICISSAPLITCFVSDSSRSLGRSVGAPGVMFVSGTLILALPTTKVGMAKVASTVLLMLIGTV